MNETILLKVSLVCYYNLPRDNYGCRVQEMPLSLNPELNKVINKNGTCYIYVTYNKSTDKDDVFSAMMNNDNRKHAIKQAKKRLAEAEKERLELLASSLDLFAANLRD